MTATAGDVFISTGDPDGKMAMASRPSGNGKIEIETGDDFILGDKTSVTSVSFTGLLTGGATAADISQVVLEIYRVFPLDSGPPSGNVLTRVNSPSDVAFDSRDSGAGGLTFLTVGGGTFTADNSVLNGINKFPNQKTGGEGPVTGLEVTITASLITPFILPANHYFLVPQVLLSNANEEFYWLSAPKPIVPPGTPFLPDLQAWIRNENLAPDWSRVGTDIEGAGQNLQRLLQSLGPNHPRAILGRTDLDRRTLALGLVPVETTTQSPWVSWGLTCSAMRLPGDQALTPRSQAR